MIKITLIFTLLFASSFYSTNGLEMRRLSKRQAVSGAPCSSSSDLTPATTDCSKFQRCANGITYIFSCGPGTVFNPSLKVCDYPYNVPQPCTVGGSSSGGSGSSSGCTTSSTGVVTGSPAGSSCSSSADLTPWSSDCTQFQRCANGITYVFSCGPGTVFNPSLKVCDYPYNVPQPCTVGGSSSGCAAASTAATTAATTAASGSGGSAVSGAPCTSANDLTPATTDCSKFQRCANGITYIFSCGPGTVFNPNLRVCDYPYNVPQPCTVSGGSAGSTSAATAASTAAPTSASTTAATVPASTTSNTYPNCFLSLTSTDRATYCADPSFVSSFPGCCP